jgi:hypothetical protein
MNGGSTVVLVEAKTTKTTAQRKTVVAESPVNTGKTTKTTKTTVLYYWNKK